MDLFTSETILLLLILCSLASVAGFLAGLLGIGGGLVLVPGLYFTFSSLGYESDYLMHVSVGTSLATIMATGISSARSHHKRGAVDFDVIKKIAPGLVFGVILGGLVASKVDSFWLQCFFVPALFLLATLMLLNPKGVVVQSKLPNKFITAPITTVIGLVSSLMGIGGAALNVPFMTLCHVPMHKAIGSAAAMGILVAVVGTISFFTIGLGQDPDILPPFTYGYINVLSLAIIMPITILMAPLGVATAHRFSIRRLKRIFSVFLYFLCFRMAAEIFPVIFS